ncbi:lysostaphin resistance A-like protein [Microbispora sp. NPDC049125]|uniref:CPBP family intramembrane glutamic endopeptidase n=1 Tax=Microbispora sp. NPDC049125 TaxID=3154929 RepID=UPI003467DD00
MTEPERDRAGSPPWPPREPPEEPGQALPGGQGPYGAGPQQGPVPPGGYGAPWPSQWGAQAPPPYQWGAQAPPPYQWQAPPAPWTAPPPPQTRYDRLARTALHRWWRPIVGTLGIVIAFLVMSLGVGLLAGLVSVIAGIPMAVDGSRLFIDPVVDLGFHLIVIALAIPLVFGAAWAFQRRPPGTVSSVAFRIRWRWLGWCLLVAVVAVVLGQLAESGTLTLTGVGAGYGWAGWAVFLPPMILILLLVPFQAAAEEYVFRGWILQSFGAYLRNPWPGVLLGSAAFAALHGYTDWGIAYVFGFGILMGWLAILTGGLEAPIALHATNNVVAFGLAAASGDMGGALEQGALPWQSIAGTAVQFAVYGVAIVIIARKRAIQTLSG